MIPYQMEGAEHDGFKGLLGSQETQCNQNPENLVVCGQGSSVREECMRRHR